jgi:beta-galactosidase/beta-glucuronidase
LRGCGISDALREGENALTVSVWDPSDTQPIQRGKQVLKPNFIWYTAISGIWQTVWLEHVPETYMDSIKLTPDTDHETLTVETQVIGFQSDHILKARVLDEGEIIVEFEGSAEEPLTIPIKQPNLWSPDSPHLYDLELSLAVNVNTIDRI